MDERDDSPERGEWNPDPEEEGRPELLPYGERCGGGLCVCVWLLCRAGHGPALQPLEEPRKHKELICSPAAA